MQAALPYERRPELECGPEDGLAVQRYEQTVSGRRSPRIGGAQPGGPESSCGGLHPGRAVQLPDGDSATRLCGDAGAVVG
jgi:hypothetical protein